MANRIYEVEAPDGSILEIEGPDGASEADLFKAAGELWKPPAKAPEALPERTWGEAATDVKNLVGRGMLGTYSAPVDYFRPDLNTLGKEKEEYAKALSPQYQAKKKGVTAAIEAKEQEGFLPGLGEAFKQYGSNPDVAVGAAMEALPSMATSAMIAAGTAASGGTAAVGLALTAMWNAIQNGGSARKDAYDEVKKDELKKGKSPEEAHASAMWESLGPGAVGSIIGSFTGKSGVEEVFAGGAKKGAKEAFKKAAKEWFGEQGEEVLPKVATNYAVDKPLTAGLPEVMAATTAGAAPGTTMAGVGSMVGKEPPTPIDPNVAAEAAGEVTPMVEQDPVEAVPVTDELPFETLTGGAQGGILAGTELEVDENGMPIDVKGSLELQQTERGEAGVQEDMFSKEPKDISEALNEEAKRNRERAWTDMAQQTEMGPPVTEEVIKRQKEAAFAANERANEEWKQFTEMAAFNEQDWAAIKEMVASGKRDTSMAIAMSEAFGSDIENITGVDDQRGDPIFLQDGSALETPAKAFYNFFLRYNRDFVKAWEGSDPAMRNWARRTFGTLVSEDSIRGDIARRILLLNAAKTEVNLEAKAITEKLNGPRRSLRTAEEIKATAITSSNDFTQLNFREHAKWARAVEWVTKVFPRLTRNVEYISLFTKEKMLDAQMDYFTFKTIGLSASKIDAAMLAKHPWLKVVIETSRKAGHDYYKILEYGADHKDDEVPKGFAFPIWTEGKERPKTVIFVDAEYVKTNPVVNLVGTLVHELVHAYHGKRSRMQGQKAIDEQAGLRYHDKWTEQRARQGQETARIKFIEMYRKELIAKGDPESIAELRLGTQALYFEKRTMVPGSARANMTGGRNAGAIGPSRLPANAKSYVNTREGARFGFKEAWGDTDSLGRKPGQTFAENAVEVGTEVVKTGTKLFGDKYLRGLSSMPNVSTTDFLGMLGNISKDIWNQWGLRTGTYRGTTPTLLNPTTGDFVYAHVTQKFVKHSANEHANNAKARTAWETLEGHYSADSVKLFGKLDVGTPQLKSKREAGAKAFAKDAKIVLWFEKNPDQWFDGQNYYPTVQQMVDQGLSKESAKVWRGVMDQYEQLWSTLEDAVGIAGRHAVARVPGYMPHTTIGQYKAQAVSIDPKTGETVKYHAEVGAATEAEALRNLELLKKYFAGQKVSFVVAKPEPGKYDVASVLEGLRKARDLAGNIEGLKKLAEIIESNAARGVITHALDRGEVARFGHTLQRATFYGTDFGMDLKGQMEAVRGFREYVKAVNGYTERVKFVRDTLGPLDMSGALDLPNLREAIFNNFKDYVGISNVNKLDTSIKSGLVRMGWDPRLIDTYVNQIQSGMAAFYLIGNVPFYVVNSVQATASVPLLFAKQAELRLAGETNIPDMHLAVGRGMKRMKNLWSEQSRLRDPAIRWAEEHGYLDPQAHEAMQPNAVGIPRDFITAGIDRKTRQIAFVIGYEFYRQTFDHETSLHKAGAFSKEVAVPYEKSVGKPSVLNRIPVVGQAATLFTTYPAHILGMLENQTTMAIAAKKAGDYKAMAQVIAGMSSYVGLQAAMFGLMAIPFAGFLGGAADELNKLLGRPAVPNVQRLARVLDEVMGTNGLAQFGIISKTLGYDISSSAQGVQPTMPTAAARALEILFTAAILTGGAFIGKTSQQDVWNFARKLPGQHRGPMDWILRDYPETTAQEHFREKGAPRTVADQWAVHLTGVRSLQEKSQMTTEQLLKTDSEIISRRMESISNRMKNKGTIDEATAKELNELAKDFQIDPTPVINGFITWMETKDVSPDLRKAMRANSTNGAASYQRFLKEQSLEPTRPQ